MDLNRMDKERVLYDGESVGADILPLPTKPAKAAHKPLIVVIGESGSGKDSIVSETCRRYGYHQAMTYTTRPKRYPEEATHYFIDDISFESLQDDIVATTEFDGNKYGCTYDELNNSDFCIMDVKGAEDILQAVEDGRITRNVQIVYIFAFPAIRLDRMLSRGDSEEQAMQRLEHDQDKFKRITCLPIAKVLWNCGALMPCVRIMKKLIQGEFENAADASEGFIC